MSNEANPPRPVCPEYIPLGTLAGANKSAERWRRFAWKTEQALHDEREWADRCNRAWDHAFNQALMNGHAAQVARAKNTTLEAVIAGVKEWCYRYGCYIICEREDLDGLLSATPKAVVAVEIPSDSTTLGISNGSGERRIELEKHSGGTLVFLPRVGSGGE